MVLGQVLVGWTGIGKLEKEVHCFDTGCASGRLLQLRQDHANGRSDPRLQRAEL